MKAKEYKHCACDNCKNFVKHFYRANYNYWISLKCGECRIKKFTEEEREKLPFGFVCDKWTQKTCDETDISEIKNELGDITARLILIVKALSK